MKLLKNLILCGFTIIFTQCNNSIQTNANASVDLPETPSISTSSPSETEESYIEDAPAAMSNTDYDKKINKHKLILVDFGATWCGPCKRMKPVLHNIVNSKKGKLRMLAIDTDQNPGLAARFHIDAIPAMMLYKNGKVVWNGVGQMDEQALVAEFAKWE